MTPMISIIIPVYNLEKYIGNCIESIKNQTYQDFELILVNDGSTDNSLYICKKYAESDHRIRVFSKENGGQSSARNLGLKNIRGEWVMFIDGDDYLVQSALENLTKIHQKVGDSIDILQYGFQEQYESGKETDNYDINEELEILIDKKHKFNKILELGGEAISPCTKLIKASLLTDITFIEGIIMEDEDFSPRLFLKSVSVAYTKYKPYVYIRRENSTITSKFSTKRLSIIPIMNNRFHLMEDNGIEDLIPKFRIKYILSLMILSLAALGVRDKRSFKFLLSELKIQLKKIDLFNSDLSKVNLFKLQLIKHNLPFLQLEAIIRKLLKKEICFGGNLR